MSMGAAAANHHHHREKAGKDKRTPTIGQTDQLDTNGRETENKT